MDAETQANLVCAILDELDNRSLFNGVDQDTIDEIEDAIAAHVAAFGEPTCASNQVN